MTALLAVLTSRNFTRDQCTRTHPLSLKGWIRSPRHQDHRNAFRERISARGSVMRCRPWSQRTFGETAIEQGKEPYDAFGE